MSTKQQEADNSATMFHGASPPPSHAPSQGSLSPQFAPYQQTSHYPVPGAIPRKALFPKSYKKKGRGKSYLLCGGFQVVIGLVCFVLALVGVSVSTTGDSYSAGFVAGIVFTVTGIFGCFVGTSNANVYAMTYLVLNVVSLPAALLTIGLSGWELHGMGTPKRVISNEGFIVIKSVIIMMGCVAVFFVCLYHVYRLRGTDCCECGGSSDQPDNAHELRGYSGPMNYPVPPDSHPTTNSSWHWNLHPANIQQGQPNSEPVFTTQDQQRYLSQMQPEGPEPDLRYTPQDSPRGMAYDSPPVAAIPHNYDPNVEANVHIQPAYI